MRKQYLLNVPQNRMHIKGFCNYTSHMNDSWRQYSSEEEARQEGMQFIMCKICQKEIEKRITEKS